MRWRASRWMAGIVLAAVAAGILVACASTVTQGGAEPAGREPTRAVEQALATASPQGVQPQASDDRPAQLRMATLGWSTDWTRHNVDLREIISGGPPRDGIPSIDDPKFITPAEAREWLQEREPVIALEIDGDARAYPLQVLTWHEIVNDTVGGVPVAVTFCPLCNSALTFDRRLDGQVLEFGTSGLLRNSDLVMYDRTTESLWQQFTGEAIVGELTGVQLKFVPASIVGYGEFEAAHPDGQVLSRETGFNRRYGENPYVGYDSIDQTPFLFSDPVDGRLPAMERVVGVQLPGDAVAYPYSVLREARVINDRRGDQDLVIFNVPGTASALGAAVIATGEDVGATGVFSPVVDGQRLTFRWDRDRIVDEETGSRWNVLGQAVDGALAGRELEPIVHGNPFWFSWAAFRPDTIIYQP